MAYCQNCGKKISKDEDFCSYCGKRMRKNFIKRIVLITCLLALMVFIVVIIANNFGRFETSTKSAEKSAITYPSATKEAYCYLGEKTCGLVRVSALSEDRLIITFEDLSGTDTVLDEKGCKRFLSDFERGPTPDYMKIECYYEKGADFKKEKLMFKINEQWFNGIIFFPAEDIQIGSTKEFNFEPVKVTPPEQEAVKSTVLEQKEKTSGYQATSKLGKIYQSSKIFRVLFWIGLVLFIIIMIPIYSWLKRISS